MKTNAGAGVEDGTNEIPSRHCPAERYLDFFLKKDTHRLRAIFINVKYQKHVS